MKIKMKRNGIQQKLCKLGRKKKIATRSSKYNQSLYSFFKNINFVFRVSKMHQEIEFL